MDVYLDGFGDIDYIVNNLRYADNIEDYFGYRFVVVGGACLILLGVEMTIHGDVRVTEDVDVVAYNRLSKSVRDLSGAFEFHTAEFYHLYLDGWEKRLNELVGFENIEVYYLNEIDLFFSKIARGSMKDIEDCVALIRHFSIDANELVDNFSEWIRFYPSNEKLVRDSFNYILRMVGYA